MSGTRRAERSVDKLSIQTVTSAQGVRPDLKKERVAGIILGRELELGALFIREVNTEKAYFGTTSEIFSLTDPKELMAYLHNEYGINATSEWMKSTTAEFVTKGLRLGDRKIGRRFVAFDTKEQVLYITRWDGRVRRLDGTSITEISNGAEVFFLDDDHGVDVDVTLPPGGVTAVYGDEEPTTNFDVGPHGELLPYLTNLAFCQETLGDMSPEQQKILLTTWLFAVVFPDLVTSKPILILEGAPGSGKCLRPDTPVLYFDGTIAAAEQVQVGDQLMGPDSQPRTVLSTTVGQGLMYRVTPIKGSPWECNDKHVLTLIGSGAEYLDQIIDISIEDYLKKPNRFKDLHTLFQPSEIAFPKGERLPIDPYFLGVWFGDGSKTTNERGLAAVSITKPDPEIEDICRKVAHIWGLQIRRSERNACPTWDLTTGNIGGKENALLTVLRNLVGDNTTIPQRVLTGSREARLDFLAGFLDTDGHLTSNCYEIVQKREDYRDAILFLARSLGFRATTRVKYVNDVAYHRIFISGHVDRIPLRIPRKKAKPRQHFKNVLKTGFSVDVVGHGPFVGFQLNGDGRFLLGDFTVTHNSTSAVMMQAVIHGKEHGMILSKDGERDFAVQLLRSPIAIFDNVDSYIDWIPDAICAYTTVGKWEKRKLYSDDDQMTIAPLSFPVIASKNPSSFRREDVADRSIILRLDRRTEANGSGGFKPMQHLMADLRAKRPRLFGEYLYWCNQIVAAIRSGVWAQCGAGVSAFRQADFAQMAFLVGHVLQWDSQEIVDTLEALTREQRRHSGENDDLVETMTNWIRQFGGANRDRHLSVHEIFSQIEQVASQLGNKLKFNENVLGARLRMGYLEEAFDIDKTIDKTVGQHRYRLRLKKVLNLVDEDLPLSNVIPMPSPDFNRGR
jgi:hypothetical protein